MTKRFLRVFLAAVIAALQIAAPQAAMSAAGEPNICPVMLHDFFRAGHVYVADFTADDAAEYNGSATFFSGKNAYELVFKDMVPGRIAFSLPSPDDLQYGSMDTAGKKTETETSCPTFVVGSARNMVEGYDPHPAMLATLRGPLPGLPCGKMLQEASVIEASAPNLYAPFKKADVLVKIYVDAEGHGFAPSIMQSSGDNTLDIAALQAARRAKYHPRQFLCAPIIGVYSFRLHYQNSR